MKAAVAVFIHSNKGIVLDFSKSGVNLIHTITFFSGCIYGGFMDIKYAIMQKDS